MFKRLLFASLLVIPFVSSQASADAATAAIGYYSTSCGSAPPPCFIQYGATIPVSATITPSGTQDVNLKNINGNIISVGTGASNTGTQRVVTSTDSTIGVEGQDGSTQSSPSNPFNVINPIGSTFTPSQVSLTTSSSQILATIALPSAREVCNIDTAIVEYVGATGVTSTTGIPLSPGQCWDASHTSAAIFAVSASATPKMAVVQY